ncbi:MAG TPA: RidA family protein, partial [Chromatiales bacterium]|nr:RidA family protein [Chromatiales bacterium]
MDRHPVQTPDAPAAIGTYSQAIRTGDTLYISGQIPLDPATGELVDGDITAQVRRVFDNLRAVAKAAGGDLNDAVKITVYLVDLVHFPVVNEIMAEYLRKPYPARAAVGVAALPKG